MTTTANSPVAIALVHGGFVDGSGWEDVYKILRKDGYDVSIVQNPTTTLADDVAATQRVIADKKAPVLLVGHSYGGVVITEAGNAPNVAGLIYITAFAPDSGESVASLIKDPAPGAPVPPIRTCENPFMERKIATHWHSPASITPIAMPISASVEDPPPMQSM